MIVEFYKLVDQIIKMKRGKIMTLQLLEHLSQLSEQERLRELCILFLVMLILIAIAIFLDYIKIKYENKVKKSNNKIIKFILKHIL